MLVRSISKITGSFYTKSCNSLGLLNCAIRKNHDHLPSNIVFLDGPQEEQVKEILPEIPKDVNKSRTVTDIPAHRQPVVTWLHDFTNSIQAQCQEAVELHPEIFADNPRMDYLCNAIEWQKEYREVDYTWKPTRADVGYGKRKPWPQKGTGRARHGSTNAPQWRKGGKANAPRGPVSLYYEQPIEERIKALTSALTVRQIQNDLLIIKDFALREEMESLNFKEIFEQHAIEEDSSMLIVHHSSAKDVTESSFKALEEERKINILSVIALNVYSILKHDKLVLTLDAALELENKLTWHKSRYDWLDKPHNFYTGIPFANEELSDFAEEINEEDVGEDRFDVLVEEFEELDGTDLPYGRM